MKAKLYNFTIFELLGVGTFPRFGMLASTAMKLDKLQDSLKDKIDAMYENRKSLLSKFGPVKPDNENFQEYLKEFNEYLSLEFEIDIPEFEISEFSDVKLVTDSDVQILRVLSRFPQYKVG